LIQANNKAPLSGALLLLLSSRAGPGTRLMPPGTIKRGAPGYTEDYPN